MHRGSFDNFDIKAFTIAFRVKPLAGRATFRQYEVRPCARTEKHDETQNTKAYLQADAKSGSSVPLTLNGSNGGADTTVNLTEGANITLTRNSATEITIASTDTGALGDRVALTGGSTAGGLTTFAYTVTSSFAGAVALDVKCEVITAAGQTVYADVTRSGTTLSVIFTGTVADSTYEALLTYVG